MTNEEHHEHLTITEFIEEFWIVFFFGTFFLMTMFLPLLFLDNRNWMYWAVVVTLGIIFVLLAVLLGRKKLKHH